MDQDAELITSASVRVTYGDVDRMGFAYYGNYLRWFEIGRAEYLRARGRPYREIEAEGLAMPVVEAYVRYRRPAAYDDVLEVRTTPRSIERVRVTFGYQIVRAGAERSTSPRAEPGAGDLLTEGHTVHACTGASGRPRRFPPELLDLLRSPPQSKP